MYIYKKKGVINTGEEKILGTIMEEKEKIKYDNEVFALPEKNKRMNIFMNYDDNEISKIEEVLLSVARETRNLEKISGGYEPGSEKSKIDELQKEYIKNKKFFVENEHLMSRDQRIINNIILSFEERVYFGENNEKRGYGIKNVVISDKKNTEMVTEKLDKNVRQINTGQLTDMNDNKYFFTPVISNTSQNEMKPLTNDESTIDWSRIIYESDNKENNLNKELFDSKKKKYRPYKCLESNCDKCYTSLYGLKYHQAHGHTKNEDDSLKPFACEIVGCKKRYKNTNGLKYHLENNHRFDN